MPAPYAARTTRNQRYFVAEVGWGRHAADYATRHPEPTNLARIFHQPLGKSGAEPAKKRGPSELHSASWGLATNSLSWRRFRLGATG